MHQAAGAKSSTSPVFVEGGWGGICDSFLENDFFPWWTDNDSVVTVTRKWKRGSTFRTQVKSLGQGKV